MAIQKVEIAISVIVITSLFLLFIFDTTKIVSNYLVTTIINPLIYCAVCYLHINRISTVKWKILITVLSLCLVTLIISNHFYIHPWRWDFVSRVIFGISMVSTVAFLLLTFTHDRRSTILFTIFAVVVDQIFFNLADSRSFNVVCTVIISIIVYAILSIFYIKQIFDRGWTVAAVASIFAALLVLGIILRIYWYNNQMLFRAVISIDGCLSLVPLLWMCAPKLKAWWKIHLEQEIKQDEQYDDFLNMAGLPTRFTITELCKATSNFESPIGEGASGAVFKGTLADGSTIAVKRIKWQDSGKKEFATEITIIASLQHVNLVRLLGYCVTPQGDRYLVYPFFENRSLDSWLFKDDQTRSYLTWPVRYHIAIDVAKALAYLHHECHHRILHLDVKPANILLDGNFRALVSDFGISKLIERDESCVMTRARGTVGYLAPEMLVPNAISTKSDVYSYGMVLLELVGGRRNFMLEFDRESRQRRNSYFPKIVREKMMQDRLMEVVDESLSGHELEIREEEVTVLVRLALWCIQENPELRPSMKEVVDILEGRMPVYVPPKSPMYIVKFLDTESSQSSMAPQAQEDEATQMSGANTLSISIQSGR